MKRMVRKTAKVALCRKCFGKGYVYHVGKTEPSVCPQCEGSGRVVVSAEMEFDIRPYKTEKKE